jgi:hypothetical protein
LILIFIKTQDTTTRCNDCTMAVIELAEAVAKEVKIKP